ncbi:cobalamin trafficking protein CblD-like isoform X2 [Tubulanus polymorphus]|uniref:cobalamin trafficking protein CblD-like isoform X2 n=1 Tax=Tubulanus polymorphus TaxID=672921 RepID=UPI003DA21B67
MAAASRFTCQRRICGYMPSVRAVVRHFRAFSSYDERIPESRAVDVDTEQHNGSHRRRDSETVWPDKTLGPFGPQDRRFPLPGLVGTSSQLETAGKLSTNSVKPLPDILTEELPAERHAKVYDQFIQTVREAEEMEQILTEPSMSDVMECVVQDCPKLLKKDFADLFPDRDITSRPLTVITISQKSENDMSAWNEDIEMEREELLSTFITGANDICAALNEAGYWADFIDPSSGTPFLGAHTNATFFETDERYRNFGFEIEDLGCCKVIRHRLWGTNSYVGCIFTDAPIEHPAMQQIQNKKNWD